MDKKQPKWVNRLIDRVHEFWSYHFTCSHINTMVCWDEAQEAWVVNVAPVYQEVLGGEDDGEKVWAGFFFEAGEFSNSPGVQILAQAVASYCNDCTPIPKLMIKGRFEGRLF